MTCLNLLLVEIVSLKGHALELVFVEGCEEGNPFEILKLTVGDFCGEDP